MVDYIKQPTPEPVISQQAREDHATLPEAVRFENALAIWVRGMRDEQLALVRNGGRLSVAALAFEEVIRLRGLLNKFQSGFLDERRLKIQARWDRRKVRRDARGVCLSCVQTRYCEPQCTAGRQCVTAGRDSTRG